MLRSAIRMGLVFTLGLAGTTFSQGKEHYRALAVNMSNIEFGGPTTVDIVIERWSTDAEEMRLVEAFQKGQDELLKAIQGIRPRVGYVALPGETGWNLGYANKAPLEDGGWQIVILTDRPIRLPNIKRID